MKRWLPIGTALLATVALAQAVRTYTLTVDGKASTVGAIVVNGRTYVPLDALRAAGATATLSGDRLALTLPRGAATGGADQKPALEGCANETLFNGVWRFRVLNQDGTVGPDGKFAYVFTVEFRNGTARPLDLNVSGAAGPILELTNMQLALKDGKTLPPGGSILDRQAIATKSVPQGAPHAFRLTYFPEPDASGNYAQPDKLVVAVSPTPSVKYPVPNPSFRIRLDCAR